MDRQSKQGGIDEPTDERYTFVPGRAHHLRYGSFGWEVDTMMYKLIVSIDVDVLRQASDVKDVEQAIEQEMAWVGDSGIYLESMEEVK